MEKDNKPDQDAEYEKTMKELEERKVELQRILAETLQRRARATQARSRVEKSCADKQAFVDRHNAKKK